MWLKWRCCQPNTFKAVHTIIAFKVVASEFHHRVHMYQDQGFFEVSCRLLISTRRSAPNHRPWLQDNLVAAVEFAMETREQELDQYCNMDYIWIVLGLVSGFRVASGT